MTTPTGRLDAVSPATHPGRDAAGFRAIRSAAKNVETAEAELRQAVHTAREAGDSWAVIGTALGISRQAAQQRFS
ncbi:hypothetical protein FV141_00375 [Dermacoccus abyssi]|uniref:AsnC family protein n=1 Tax=Dermacoccus abyssi TaxID=322596 RepID=A0ABX5Z5Z5_9MICO|nr:hypothetical protein FV141_00375 [Dermacoccus abyssi]